MANEIFKEIKTRLSLKYNTYEYWTTGEGKDYQPFKGEVCFCEIPSGNAEATTAPTVLFKVGIDGQTKFSALKWASALAADVYDWAKNAGTNVFTKEGTGNVVSGITYDATLNGGKGGFKYTTASVATAEGLAELQKEVYGENGTADNSRIDKIEKDIEDNRAVWGKYEDTRYSFSTDGDKLVVKKTLYTNGVAGTEEAVGTYEFLTTEEANALIGKANITIKGANGLTGEDTFNVNATEDKTITIQHGDTSDASNLVANGRKYVTGLTFDDYGHVTAYTTGEEADQPVPEYSIIKDSASDYAATYHLTKDGVNVGAAINIPKDMVVESGEVKELEAGSPWGDAGTYIVLTLANATSDKLYINVGTLIEYVTGGNTADIVVSVDPITHIVTATLTEAVKNNIALGVTAHGWGDHKEAGYASAQSVTDITKDGGIIDTKIAGKADKVSGATNGNFAGLDANGNLTDSGKKATDFVPMTTTDNITKAHANIFTSDSGKTQVTGDNVEIRSSAVGGKAYYAKGALAATDNDEIATKGDVNASAITSAGEGLKITDAEVGKKIEIDTDVVFWFNCNY